MLPHEKPRKPPFVYRKPESFYAITDETRRLLSGDPGKALNLRQLRCFGRDVLLEAQRMQVFFERVVKWIRKHHLAQKVWRPEMEFIGFRVGNRPIKGQKIRLHANVDGVRIIIETE